LKPSDLAREIALPITAPSVLFSLLMFFVFLQIALLGRIFGLVVALVLAAQLVVFVLPALLRTLMQLLEARSIGREPDPPVIEFFSWVGNMWTLFPLLHVAVFAYVFYFAGDFLGIAATCSIIGVHALLLPASLIVLAVTHSVVESVDPRAILLLLRRCGIGYLIGPLFLIAAVTLVFWLRGRSEYDLLADLVGCYLLFAAFAAFALFGGMARPLQLQLDLDVPEVERLRTQDFAEQQSLVRGAVLNHAYGLISRGNRAGGLEHLFAELADDPDAVSGWYWYFDHMLRWENNTAGLAFAQHYVHDLLRNGDYVAAVKVMLRCQRVNPAFKPLAEDLPQAIAAAEECRNDELASSLRN
jgi:hypothetical protein